MPEYFEKLFVFCTLYPRGYTAGGSAPYNFWCRCQKLASLKELMMSQKKFWTCFFSSISFGDEQQLSKNCNFSLLGKQCFYLTRSAPEYFEKLALKKGKHPTSNTSFSKTRTNLLFFARSTQVGTRQGTLPPATPGTATNDSQRSNC